MWLYIRINLKVYSSDVKIQLHLLPLSIIFGFYNATSTIPMVEIYSKCYFEIVSVRRFILKKAMFILTVLQLFSFQFKVKICVIIGIFLYVLKLHVIYINYLVHKCMYTIDILFMFSLFIYIVKSICSKRKIFFWLQYFEI